MRDFPWAYTKGLPDCSPWKIPRGLQTWGITYVTTVVQKNDILPIGTKIGWVL